MTESGPPSGPADPPPDRSSPPPDDEGSTGEEAAKILSEVLEEQRRKKAQLEDESGRRPKGDTRKKIITAGMAVVLVIILVARPDFLRPESAPEPPKALVEAGLRMDMYTVAVQIERFQDDRGRLPESLQQALDDPETDLRYTRVEPSYYLVGERAGVELVYRSDEPLDSLLADAREVIRGGARRPDDPASGGGQ